MAHDGRCRDHGSNSSRFSVRGRRSTLVHSPARACGVSAAEAQAAGRDPATIATQVWINVAAGSTVEEVADAVQLLADHGYPDAFVDLMYVETAIDGLLGWVATLVG